MLEPLSPSTLAYIEKNARADVDSLALNPGNTEGADLRQALTQIEGRQRMSLKVPRLARVEQYRYPSRLPLEQCSSEATALYKARLVDESVQGERKRLVDLTGGLGVDFMFMAPLFDEAVYVERQEELCGLAAFNFPLLGLQNARVCRGDAAAFLSELPDASLIYLDPARRNGEGRRVVLLSDCSPDVTLLAGILLEKSASVLVKLSPMLDLQSLAVTLPSVRQLHVVAVGGEVKELLVLMSRGFEGEPLVVCSDVKGDEVRKFSFHLQAEAAAQCRFPAVPGKFLYEPSAAVLKGGAFKLVAQRYGLGKLAPNSHLYTSDESLPPSAFPGRAFRVEAWGGFGKKELRSLLSGLAQANITVRGFPQTVAQLRARLRLKEGGHTYLFATTMANGGKVLLRCRKTEEGPCADR